MSLSKPQLKLLQNAYAELPHRIYLYRWQWKTARCLRDRDLAGICNDGTLMLWSATIQVIELGRSMR
jgi:hypothetical protein